MRESSERDHESEPLRFGLPFPPPFGPPPDVLLLAHDAAEAGSEREDEDIMLRRVPTGVARRFRAAAGARGMTHAAYLTALVELHEAMRRRADSGDVELAAELDELRLGTVSI